MRLYHRSFRITRPKVNIKTLSDLQYIVQARNTHSCIVLTKFEKNSCVGTGHATLNSFWNVLRPGPQKRPLHTQGCV